MQMSLINVIKKLSLQRSDFNIHIISDGDTKNAQSSQSAGRKAVNVDSL